MTEKKRGRCLCGAVRFSATLESGDVGVCHCSMCRRWAAGPFFGLPCVDLVFDSEKSLAIFKSSAWAERGACKECGSPLFWRMQDRSMTIVSVNAIDEPGALKLDHEVYIDEKPSYYEFAQETRQLTGADIQKMVSGGGE